MAKIITLDGLTFTKPGLPIAYNEPLLVPGSLALVDPTHPISPWATGVPADAAQVPNLAAKALKALMPSETDARLNGEINNVFATSGLFERSSKGGLHGIIKQINYTALESNGVFLAAVRDYIAANPTHLFYHGLYGRTTRKDSNTVSNTSGSYAGMQTASGDYMTLRPSYGVNQIVAAPSAQRIGSTVASNAVGNFRVSGSMQNLSGTPMASSLLLRWVNNHLQGGTNPVCNASWILYSYYIEDLTVSGRTFAQVDALRSAAYTKDVLTAGGRYYGDTFTEPTTVV